MTRWGHGHSVATGVLLMALASRHLALILCLVFAAGFVAGRCWQLVALVETSLRRRLGRRAARKAIPY